MRREDADRQVDARGSFGVMIGSNNSMVFHYHGDDQTWAARPQRAPLKVPLIAA
jgi:hypothetical protein